ncbi:FAD-dependent oxidoreductase [Desulfosporosinus fructosivorans]
MAIITIDGIRIQSQVGRNVLECALESGVYIPHLCHHQDLTPLGSCRLCLVEVEGQDGVLPSCTLEVQDGLSIRTKSDHIDRLRRLALELILAGHPADCSTCPKYGNCELQTVIQYLGVSGARMRMRSKGFVENTNNALFEHDMNRCVLCGRCVRACHDLRDVGILNYNKKHMEIYIGTIEDKLLKDAGCRFCGACAEVCPTGAIRDKERLVNVNLSRNASLVPCRASCPAGTDVPRYVRLTKEEKYDEATAVVREKAPFPKILGYICNHFCESECRRKEVKDAISIRNLKRYAAEHDEHKIWKARGKQLVSTGKKVGVVGSGPAGLTAAYYLQKQGHSVTVFEALPYAGGMMRVGIPAYRLPDAIVKEEISIVTDIGVVIQTNKRVNLPASLLKQGFDAVLVSIGAHKGIRLPIKGSNLHGVLLNTDFLRDARIGNKTGIGKRVVVLGGGNVAFDCARTAKRLGAEEVHLVCLEDREHMPADDEEILEAGEEGIQVHPGRSFEQIFGDINVLGVELQKVSSFSFDENRSPVLVKEEGSAHVIEADTVIFAVGQRPEIAEDEGLVLGRGNCIVVNEDNLQTSEEAVFAAGDAIYGTNSVITAIASGRKAATSIDRFLGGDGNIDEVLAPREEIDPKLGFKENFAYEERREPDCKLPVDEAMSFDLVNQGLNQTDACYEAGRCLQCDLRTNIKRPRLWNEFSVAVGKNGVGK